MSVDIGGSDRDLPKAVAAKATKARGYLKGVFGKNAYPVLEVLHGSTIKTRKRKWILRMSQSEGWRWSPFMNRLTRLLQEKQI